LGILRHKFCSPYCRAWAAHVGEVPPSSFSLSEMCIKHICLSCYFESGITSVVGEQCLVASTAGLGLEPCLDAVAAGDGREVMQFDEDSISNTFT